MISLYKNEKQRKENNNIYMIVELRGLSTDTKPTTYENYLIDNGSVFIELDTQNLYFYDLENEEWINPDVEQEQESEGE